MDDTAKSSARRQIANSQGSSSWNLRAGLVAVVGLIHAICVARDIRLIVRCRNHFRGRADGSDRGTIVPRRPSRLAPVSACADEQEDGRKMFAPPLSQIQQAV